MAGVVAGALGSREIALMGLGQPNGQPAEVYPVEFMAAVSSSTAAEPSVRVQVPR